MQKRIFGTENEYSFVLKLKDGGFQSARPDPFLLPMLQNINSYKSLSRYRISQKSSQVVEKRFWLGSNGGLFYLDWASQDMFPEYSTPECDSVKLCIAHDKAGEAVVNDIRLAASQDSRDITDTEFIICKNTTAYPREMPEVNYVGCHENYLTDCRFNPYRVGQNINMPNPSSQSFCDFLTPFLVSRVIIHGSGGIRWSQELGWHYVISQRAFAMNKLTGVGTTSDRALIQFKAEHSPPNTERLHLIYSDPSMSPFAAFLKMGIMHLVLRVFEENEDLHPPVNISDPLFRMCVFSRDISLTRKVADFKTGEEYTAIQIQREYLNLVLKRVKSFSEEESKILELWQWVLAKLEENPEELYRHLDWVIKLHYLRKIKKGMFSPEGRLFDFLYSDISENGIYNRLRKAGLIEELVTQEEISQALLNPPPTRAVLRSRYIRAILDKKPQHWYIDWDYVNLSPKIDFVDPFSAHNKELDNFIESL